MKANARSIYSAIETLESRIAPATVTFPLTDANGDHVKFTASGPLVTTSNFVSTLVTVIPLLDVGKHDAFVVNLAGSSFAGANLTVSVTKVPGGDGQTYIGITAGANNLGTVNINGDLGLLVAGAGGASDIAIKSLTVKSIGRFPSVPADVLVTSTISGSITKLAVKGNMSGTYFRVTENIGTVSIGGSVIGGDIADDGALIADGTITKVTIGGSVRGGSGAETGLVAAHGDMGTLIIRGSIYGGDGGSSGDVGSNANLTSAKVTGSIYGGNGLESGEIFGAYTTDGTIGTVTVGGSLVGGTGNDSGQIGNGGATATTVSITDVTVGGDLVGGNGELSGSVAATGGSITTLVVKGSLFGGEGELSGVVGATHASGSFYRGRQHVWRVWQRFREHLMRAGPCDNDPQGVAHWRGGDR